MNLGDTVLSKKSQPLKDEDYDCTHVRGPEPSHSWRQEWGRQLLGGVGSECFRGTEFQLCKMRRFWVDAGDGCVTAWRCSVHTEK